MQRKPSFPVANCGIKMPDCIPATESNVCEEDSEHQQKRQQLINFGHSQWGFNNWSWSVSKQELDFVDFNNGKYCAGVVAFVSITVKSFDIHRENIGYATSIASSKGLAIYKSRKCAVTNALRETLLSFGGSVATELNDLLEANRADLHNAVPEQPAETTQSPQRPVEPKNSPLNRNSRKDSGDCTNTTGRSPPAAIVKNAAVPPPVAKAHPMPTNLPPAANRPPLAANAPRPVPVPPPHVPPLRPNSNVSFVLHPVMGGVVPPIYPPPRLAPPPVPSQHMFPNAYYEYSAGPWHFTYESCDRSPGNVNLNFNLPPKNLVVNGRATECKNACRGAEGEPLQYGPPAPNQGCWIKPTIFYDGFWTEQKVKKWVAEQVEKQFPEDASQKSSSPSNPPASDTTPKP